MGYVRKDPCPKCRARGGDKSGDNLAVYDDGGKYCFSCGYFIPSKGSVKTEDTDDFFEDSMTDFTDEDRTRLKNETTTSGGLFRGIRDDTYKYFGIRHEYDTSTGELKAQYYPNTISGEFSGYKRRKIPKTFDALGTVGKQCDLFGQFRFTKSSGKYVLITAGEIDQLSAYQMLKDYQDSKGNSEYEPTPVVSPTVGESGSASQIRNNYDWLDRFERIVLCYDNDDAGREAIDKVAKVLPREKLFVMELNLKDTNEYLTSGRQKEWISAFFKARQYSPSGIIGSDRLYDILVNKAGIKKVSMPPFLKGLEDALAGGIPLKYIVNFLAGSGIGKTTLVNSMVKHWIFNSPYKVGVVSLEADCAEYASYLLSEHVGRKLSLIRDNIELISFISSEDVKDKADKLFIKEDGTPRFHLIDDRGDFDSLKKRIEQLIIQCGVQLIVIDPLSDALAGMDVSQQELFMKWMKQTIKEYDVTFININHTRKGKDMSTAASRGADLSEEDIMGSSSIYKSGGINITLVRDKHSENEIDRNTTKVTLTKCRSTGITGHVCDIYYDNESHRLFDKEDWVRGTT